MTKETSMSTRTIRLAIAFTAFLLALQWSRPAAADVTISGTVGEIGVGTYWARVYSQTTTLVRVKLTDVNQTKTCTGGDPTVPNNNVPPGYAIFRLSEGGGREWYSMLLVSKKGAPIVCILDNNVSCVVKDCVLP